MTYMRNEERGFSFIDEVTLIEDLQVYGNVFSDYYRTMGAKIVIAGTDSFLEFIWRKQISFMIVQS